MKANEFVSHVQTLVRDNSLHSVVANLDRPPGRKPRQRLLELSRWFHSLSESDRNHLREIIAEAVDEAVFGLLAILDGVRPVDPDGSFRLYHVSDSNLQLVNRPDGPMLHELFEGHADDDKESEGL